MASLERIRRVIARVPRGKVATYGQVAELAGFPRAARLTVWALHRGAALPWHRIVAAGGRIALRGGDGTEQRLRLAMEGVTFRGERVRMDRHQWKPRTGRAMRPAGRSGPRSPAHYGPRVGSGLAVPFDDAR